MPLSTGTVMGQYRIGRKLGSGGMGEVYKATHLLLRREVALKILRAEPGGDSNGSPLIEEARAASALEHPHIVTVYDVAEVDGTVYIAMEYVEGQTLRQLLLQRPLRLRETLQYAVQIASALAAAHDAGMLHRDIKPGNIMITRKNVVKVVDFGLARLFDPLETSIEEDAPTRIMDIGRHSMRDGRTCGTVGYMSPEQIRGQRVDARSDIFSFGIVLYEMLTRLGPFAALSDTGITANILEAEPRPARDLNPEVPEEVDDLVRFCLRKDPGERARSLHDVGHMLEVALLATERRSAISAATGKRRRWLIAAGVTLALIVGWALEAFLNSRTGHAQRLAMLRRITWDGGLAESPALSDDGRLLAFASDRAGGKNLDIFVRHMSGGEPIRLTNSSAGDTDPSFSPDGGMVAFRSNRQGGGVYVKPSFGGQERLVAPRGNNPRFSPDGKWIAYWIGEATNTSPSARSYIVPANGGTLRQLQPSFADVRYPVWTPDGAHILFQGVDIWKSDTDPHPDWWVTPLDAGKAAKTGAWDLIKHSGFPTIYPPGGWNRTGVVFSARNDAVRLLLSIPISARTWRVKGPAEALTFGTGIDGYPYPTSSGAIAFTSFQYEINVWSRKLDDSGRVSGDESRKLTAGAAYHTSASMNASGTRLAFLLGHTPSTDVWVRDLASGREAAMTVDGTDKCSTAISADGARIAWSLCGPGQEPVYVAAISSDLSVPVPEKVCDDCGRVVDWSPTGDSILFVDHAYPVRSGIFNLSSRSRIMISSSRYNLAKAKFSPEANWIALRAGQTRGDRTQLFAVPFQSGKPAAEADWVAITNGDFWDDNPVWTKGGDALLFYSRRDGFGCIWRQAVNPKTKQPEGAPAEVVPLHSGRLSIKELTGLLPSLCLADNQLLFNALERTGSIWVLQPRPDGRAEY